MARVTLLLVLALGASGSVYAQRIGKMATSVRDLSTVETIPFSAPPPMIMLSETKCDSHGNIYLVESGGPPIGVQTGISSLPVLQLSITSKSTTFYPVPSIDRYRGVIRSDFDVSADGHLYTLLEALDPSADGGVPSFFIAKYRSDGTAESFMKLEDPPNGKIQPFRFAIFGDESALVTGTAVEGKEHLRAFAAIVDRSGRFVTEIKIPEGSQPTPKSREKEQRGSAAFARAIDNNPSGEDSAVAVSSSSLLVSAPDGNVYFLRGTTRPRLFVVSPTGEVIRHFEIAVPATASTPTNMAAAGEGKLFISFREVQDGSTPAGDSDGPHNFISVIDSRTGEVSALYRPPADSSEIPVCASTLESFLFVGTSKDRQHLQVTRYSPR